MYMPFAPSIHCIVLDVFANIAHGAKTGKGIIEFLKRGTYSVRHGGYTLCKHGGLTQAPESNDKKLKINPSPKQERFIFRFLGAHATTLKGDRMHCLIGEARSAFQNLRTCRLAFRRRRCHVFDFHDTPAKTENRVRLGPLVFLLNSLRHCR